MTLAGQIESGNPNQQNHRPQPFAMRNTFETECRNLRSRIARSRRRMDRELAYLASRPTSWIQLGRFMSNWSAKPLVWMTAASYGLVRWFASRTAWNQSFRQRSLADWADRCSRLCRVWAWQQRRWQRARSTTNSDV